MTDGPNITPDPGFILAQEYITPPTEKPFSKFDEVGTLQRATVLAVGENLVDDHNITRKPHCAAGDIIYHAPAANDFWYDNTKYFLIHFSLKRGVFHAAKQ